MSKINKMLTAAADAGKPITDPQKMKPKPKEFISIKTMSRVPTSNQQFDRIITSLLKNYREENFQQNEVIVKDLLSKNCVWAHQANEMLYCFKEE